MKTALRHSAFGLHLCRTAGAAALMAMGAVPAFAQDEQAAAAANEEIAAEDEGAGEIVVTARKRNESLVEVPEAITAFTADQIEDAGISNIRDFANLTPNVNITSGQGVGYPSIMIRGLAQAQTGEAPVAVVIDGVQLAEPAFISQDFGDVERIEVLRGPQGSLYGRNAIGGAINIVTKQPGNEFEGRVKASYGNADTFTSNAEISGPIVADKILFRLAGSYRRTDGQIRNIFLDETADFGHSSFIHGRLIFNITDRLTLDLRANYGHDHVGNPTAEVVPTELFDDFKPGFLQSNAPVIETRDLYDFSAKIDYDAGYLDITSITGYSEVEDLNLGDADFSPTAGTIQNVLRKVKAFTQEVRISSPAEDRFRWLLGAFYQDRKTDNFLTVSADDGNGNPSSTILQNSLDAGTSKSIAGFGSASFDILPELELTLGARYDSDKRTSVDEIIGDSSAAEATFNSFQPKVQLAYKPNRNLNIYATYGKGFSSGGFNSFVSIAQSRKYEAQTAENVEVGVKGSLANGRITFAGSLFQVNYENQHFFFVTFIPVPTQNILNIDKTRVRGAELELNAHVTDRFTLSGGLGLSDAEIRANSSQPFTVGNHSPQNTAYTINVAVQYTQPITDEIDLRAYGSYRRQGEQYWDAANSLRTPPKDFVNLRLFLETDTWSIGGFVNNLTNTQYPTLAAALSGLPVNLRIPSPKRSYGIEASFRF